MDAAKEIHRRLLKLLSEKPMLPIRNITDQSDIVDVAICAALDIVRDVEEKCKYECI